MDKQQRKVRVTRTRERHSPKSVKRLGRALIALAEAQLEAEAQAQAEDAKGSEKRTGFRSANNPSSRRPDGDAA